MPGRYIPSNIPLNALALLLAAVLLVASPSAEATGEPGRPAQPGAMQAQAVEGQGAASRAAEVVLRSLSMLGVDYKWGGSSPDTGVDCSGLVRFVYEGTIGKVLPRRSVEMSREGEKIDRHELQPGDLVFFNTLRRAFSHVGIYIGNNQFVHAPAKGKQVRVSSLDNSYWSKRFNGARRVIDDADEGFTLAFEQASRGPQHSGFESRQALHGF
jgi:cell wall-associated NlpC family hydrolase